MQYTEVILQPLTKERREWFISENQAAFRFGAMEEFGLHDDHVDKDEEIISRDTILHAIDAADNQAYLILADGEPAGGLVVKINPTSGHNHLELLFVSPAAHSRGIGYGAWKALEARYPETRVWETCTPYFDKRNLHFYINKCGFSAVEFFCAAHADPNPPPDAPSEPEEGPDEMFRFLKIMR